MSAPFFDNISGTVTAGPGTGAITPTAASSGALAWSTVPANMIVNYRADEGATWEIGIGLWDGTTLTRNLEESSSGALINFGTGVVVIASISAEEAQPHIGGGKWGMWLASPGVAGGTGTAIGTTATVGTLAAGALAATNYLTRQHRVQFTSATTANALASLTFTTAGVMRSATAFMSGFEFVCRAGVSVIPTADRLCIGLSAAGTMTTVEPSALLNSAIFAQDSTDTNIQFITNDATGSGTKVDTGIALTANAFYEFSFWNNPGEAKIYYCIIVLNTGVIKMGSVTTDLPVADTLMYPMVQSGLAATTGTATVLHIQSVYLRSSF